MNDSNGGGLEARGIGAPRWAVVGIFLLLSVAAVAYARQFLVPVTFAFLLALVFSPVRRGLNSLGLPSGMAAIVIVGSLFAILSSFALTLAVPVSNLVENAPDIAARVESKLTSLVGPAAAVADAGEEMNRLTPGGQDPQVQEVVVRGPGPIATLAARAPGAMAQVGFTLVLLLFILASGDMFYEKIVHVMPTFKDKRRAVEIARGIERNVSRYLGTITLINAALGTAIGGAMWVIGMPDPVLFGVMGFAFNFVPYLGALVGVVVATAVGMVTFESLLPSLAPGVVYLLLTVIEGQFITPWLVGRRLELNTVVVFLAVAFWAWLWSVMGMLIAVPLLVVIRTFCEHISSLEGLGAFLSARGAETPNPGPDT